jgi:hypothetical protein
MAVSRHETYIPGVLMIDFSPVVREGLQAILAKEDRRPYTFILRDWVFPNTGWFIVIMCFWYLGMIVWVVMGTLLCHVAWDVTSLVLTGSS